MYTPSLTTKFLKLRFKRLVIKLSRHEAWGHIPALYKLGKERRAGNPGTTQVEGGGLEVQGWGWGNDSVGKVSASEELNPKPQNPCKTEYNSIHPQQDESQRMHGGPASPAHPAEANKEMQYKTGSEG